MGPPVEANPQFPLTDKKKARNMTPEEIDDRLRPNVPTYEDYMRQYEQLPAFDYAGFKKTWQAGEKPMMDALMAAYTKPTPRVTEKQAKRARNAAAISDAFTSLGEIFAHSRGARIRPRTGQSSSRATADRLQQLQDRYEQELLRYNTIRGNAAMQDFNMQLKAAMEADGQKRKNILLNAENARRYEEAVRKMAMDEYKYQRDRQDKISDAETKFQNDLQLIRERAKYRNTGKDMEAGLFINARPGDPNAMVDVMGRPVIPLQLNKQQISGYANSARSDREFLKATPHAYVDTFDPLTGKVVKGLTNDNNLAWMYAQWLYDQYMNQQEAVANPQKPDPPRSDFLYNAHRNLLTGGGTSGQKQKPRFNHAPY